MIKTLFNKLIEKWGASKLAKVLGLTLFGASAGTIIGANLIPDESEMETKSIEKEKENS